MGKPFYITTTIPYVNADPHIGFALEVVQADALARARRILGDEVFFNTGTDEHGQKISEAAKRAGEGEKEYVDRYAREVEKLKGVLNLSYTNFIRTTDPAHERAAQELWRRCKANGDIYRGVHEGLYCVGCEKYLTEKDIENGKCPLHPSQEPRLTKEENWFFKLSKYQNGLLEYLEREGVIVPEHRRQEALAFVRGGLEDFSVSREVTQLSWGIPVPDDETQVMYVWFDALTNYISTLGWPEDGAGNFKKFWEGGETLQTAGKDQVRFQSIMWQAMLMSADIENTDQIFYHGFVTSGGQRMSKSLGNVISPFELVARYGTDAARYLLLRHVHATEDTDVTWERLDEWYEAHLVNGLGNLVARILTLSEKHLEPVSVSDGAEKSEMFGGLVSTFRFNDFMDGVWSLIQGLDQHITRTEPFRVVKNDLEAGKKIIEELVRGLYSVALNLEPLMPETSEKILAAVRENKKPENLFPRLPAQAGKE